MRKVAVIMGSKSDLPVLKDVFSVLKSFGVEYDARVISAHRTPEQAAEYAKNARNNGIDVIIAAAGKAAHLGGVLAAFTTLPVIGLPIKSSTMDGLDSLLSMVQMPSGVPVACVAINGGTNAALLAVQILAVDDKELEERLQAYKKEMEEKILSDDAALINELD